MKRAFTFTFDGRLEQCTRVRFKADPAFKPDSYKERVLHALEGTILIKEPEARVCGIDGRISHPAELGFGIIGKVEEGGIVRVARNATASGKWQVSTLKVQIKGRIVLKGISQDDEESRSDFVNLSPHLTLSQAASLTRSIPHAGGRSQVSDPSLQRSIATFSTEAMPEKQRNGRYGGSMMEDSSVASKQVKPTSVAAALLKGFCRHLVSPLRSGETLGRGGDGTSVSIGRIGQWFRYFMGGVEIVAAILIMTLRRRILGILLTGTIVIAGTVGAHLHYGSDTRLIGMLFSAALIALYLSRNN